MPRKNIHGCDVRDMAVVEGEGEGKGQGKAEGDRGFEFTLLRGAQCRGGDLPYEDGSFGLVTLLMTLHHLEDQLEALWEVRAALTIRELLESHVDLETSLTDGRRCAVTDRTPAQAGRDRGDPRASV